MPPQFKGKLLFLLLLLVLNSVLEFLGLSFFLPIINLLISGDNSIPFMGSYGFDQGNILLFFCGFILVFFVMRIFIFLLIWKYQLNLTYRIFIEISRGIIDRVY